MKLENNKCLLPENGFANEGILVEPIEVSSGQWRHHVHEIFRYDLH